MPARAKYAEVEKWLWDWGIEDTRRHVDDDTYQCLWDGTELDVEYQFEGRSGGWLLMTKFNGMNLTRIDRHDFETALLDTLSYESLRNLYQLVVQNDHDFRPEAVIDEIEYQAAFNFFENACGDIPRPNAIQNLLPLGEPDHAGSTVP